MFACKEGSGDLEHYQEIKRVNSRLHLEFSFWEGGEYSRARGLRTRVYPVTERPLLGYDSMVQHINGDDLVKVIDEQVQTHESVPILDICCGQGIYLRDCLQVPAWKSKIDPHGIDLAAFYNRPLPSDLTRLSTQEQEKPIDFKVGDAQDLAIHYPDQSFRVITSMLGFIYFADPLSPLQDVYNLLKVGGRAYIFSCPIPIWNETERRWFIDYLQDNGIEGGKDKDPLRGTSLAIERKNPDPIQFPLQYDGWTETGWEMTDRFKYILAK